MVCDSSQIEAVLANCGVIAELEQCKVDVRDTGDKPWLTGLGA
jgi:hypothetical protein